MTKFFSNSLLESSEDLKKVKILTKTFFKPQNIELNLEEIKKLFITAGYSLSIKDESTNSYIFVFSAELESLILQMTDLGKSMIFFAFPYKSNYDMTNGMNVIKFITAELNLQELWLNPDIMDQIYQNYGDQQNTMVIHKRFHPYDFIRNYKTFSDYALAEGIKSYNEQIKVTIEATRKGIDAFFNEYSVRGINTVKTEFKHVLPNPGECSIKLDNTFEFIHIAGEINASDKLYENIQDNLFEELSYYEDFCRKIEKIKTKEGSYYIKNMLFPKKKIKFIFSSKKSFDLHALKVYNALIEPKKNIPIFSYAIKTEKEGFVCKTWILNDNSAFLVKFYFKDGKSYFHAIPEYSTPYGVMNIFRLVYETLDQNAILIS